MQDNKKPYPHHVKILRPTLEKLGLSLEEDYKTLLDRIEKARTTTDYSALPMKNLRLLNAFSGVQNDRAPIWLMRQAGRYLPEFMDVSKDFGFFEKCENPFLAAEITLQPIQRFQIDAAIIFADILTLPKAMGMNITMEPKEGPVIQDPLITPDDIPRLKEPDYNLLRHVYDAQYLTRMALEGNQALIGFVGAPWTVFAYLVEGKGSKLFMKAKKWLYLYEEGTRKVLDILAVASADYLINQVKSGAQVLQVFDSWAGDIPNEDYIDVCLPSLEKLATIFKKECPKTPLIMFARNANSVEVVQKFTAMKLEDGTPLFDGFSLDESQSQATLEHLVKENRTLQGNMEPGVLYGEVELITRKSQQMIKKMQISPKYVVNLAHGLTPDHKPEKVKVFVDAVAEASFQGYQQNK